MNNFWKLKIIITLALFMASVFEANAALIVNRPLYIGLTEGLVGHWSFDGQDMSQSTNNVWALDRSGQGKNGQLKNTATSSVRVIGKIGQALSFDGTNDYVDIGTGPTSVRSAAFWVYPNTTTEYFINLTGTTDYIWLNAGTITATGLTSPTIYVDGIVSSTLTPNKWQHVAVVTNTAENASNLDIGRTADTNYMEGEIDEVRIYNRVLSPDEIKRLYKIGSTFTVNKTRLDTMRKGLVGHWTFDGMDLITQTDGDQIALDRSPQLLHGIITGSATSTAILATLLTSGTDTTNTNVYTTASISPSANKLILAAIFGSNDTSPAISSTISGNNLTWVKVTNIEVSRANGAERRLELFRAMGNSPTAGAITITWDVSIVGSAWSIVQFYPIDTSGTNGSGAIVQSATEPSAIASSATVTLGSFSAAQNATYGAFGLDTQENQTAGSGFTELHDVALSNPPANLQTEWKNSNDTTVDESSASTQDRAGLAVEINARPLVQHPPTTPGRIGQALSFDGTNDYVDIGTGPTSVRSAAFWVYPNTTTEYFINLTGTTDYIWLNAGTITATGLTSPTIYVDGIVSSTLTPNKWQHVAVVTNTAENASNLDIGRTADTNYMDGSMDDVRLYSHALSADEVWRLYKMGATVVVNKTRADTLNEDLIGNWSFNGPDMSQSTNNIWALDRSGQGNKGVLKNIATSSVRVIGKIGQALSFDGANQWMETADDANILDGLTDYTLSAWIKPNSLGENSAGRIIDNLNGSAGGYIFALNTTNRLAIQHGGSNISSNSNAITLGQWQHVVAVHNDAADQLFFYTNGVLVGSPTQTTGTTGTNTSKFSIGASTTGVNAFDGLIDEVRVYKRALSADEVWRLYKMGR